MRDSHGALLVFGADDGGGDDGCAGGGGGDGWAAFVFFRFLEKKEVLLILLGAFIILCFVFHKGVGNVRKPKGSDTDIETVVY